MIFLDVIWKRSGNYHGSVISGVYGILTGSSSGLVTHNKSGSTLMYLLLDTATVQCRSMLDLKKFQCILVLHEEVTLGCALCSLDIIVTS